MKKFLVLLFLVFSFNAQANSWIVPLIGGLVGGIIVGEVIASPIYGYSPQPYYPPVYYLPPQPIYYQHQPVYVQPMNEYYRDLEVRRRYGNY
jgi:hypothetical protein